MVYSSGFGSSISIRTAHDLWGPWSAASRLIDCRTQYPQGVFGAYCYGPDEHDELQSAGPSGRLGETIYITVTFDDIGNLCYCLFLHRIDLATPVHEYSDGSGQVAYCADCTNPPPGTDQGIAFFAAAAGGGLLSPIDRWGSPTGEVQYASPDAAMRPPPEFVDEGVAFYARLRPDFSVRDEPVYRWDSPGSGGAPPSHIYSPILVSAPGFSRGPVAFYTPCPLDSGWGGISDCHASMQAVEGASYDADRDGCPDVKEASLNPPTDPHNPWDFYSVPTPALIAAQDPTIVMKDGAVTSADAQSVYTYFRPREVRDTGI